MIPLSKHVLVQCSRTLCGYAYMYAHRESNHEFTAVCILYYYTAYLREQRLGLWRELDWNSEIQVRVDSIRMTGGKSLMGNTCSLVWVKSLEEQDCTYALLSHYIYMYKYMYYNIMALLHVQDPYYSSTMYLSCEYLKEDGPETPPVSGRINLTQTTQLWTQKINYIDTMKCTCTCTSTHV